jgi:hyaluronoglucosaminidase
MLAGISCFFYSESDKLSIDGAPPLMLRRFLEMHQGSFQRRGVVEGFFGPQWTLSHRKALLEFGGRRGMNTYVYAPKDDPFHREKWREAYPPAQWSQLCELIDCARSFGIDFVYGFHPGAGLCFGAEEPIEALITKAERFHAAGVRTFAVLFDDIPSALQLGDDQREFKGSLAQAEGLWLKKILSRQPSSWSDVEWWLCPSYYSEDPVLEAVFGAFEPRFLEKLSEVLPENVSCFWTGPAVVAPKMSLSHVRKIARRLKRRLLLWDNYPVNDLAMSGELHLSPLKNRDPRLPEEVYGYLNNPLLQEELSFIPLGSCFDYAFDPLHYDPEKSWELVITERFGAGALPHWRALRGFCEQLKKMDEKNSSLSLSPQRRQALSAAHAYLLQHQSEKWLQEFRPWCDLLEKRLHA